MTTLCVSAPGDSSGPPPAQPARLDSPAIPTPPPEDAGASDRARLIRAVLDRSRLLADARFEVPAAVYREYLRQTGQAADEPSDFPVAYIAGGGTYRVTMTDDSPRLSAEVVVQILDHRRAGGVAVLSTHTTWENVKVNGKPAQLPATGDWLRLAPDAPGVYTVTADAPLAKPATAGGEVVVNVPATVRTSVLFDSPGAWQVTADPAFRSVVGAAGPGTHGLIALTPRERLQIDYRPPESRTEHAPRYELRGDVAWSLEEGMGQVTAVLNVAIAGGPSDRLELLLPERAAPTCG